MMTEEAMASREERAHAMWYAFQSASREWDNNDDLMSVGYAGTAVCVVRVHFVDPEIFGHQPPVPRRVRLERIG